METPCCCQFLKATAKPPDQHQDAERYEVLDGRALEDWVRLTLGDDAFNQIDKHPQDVWPRSRAERG